MLDLKGDYRKIGDVILKNLNQNTMEHYGRWSRWWWNDDDYDDDDEDDNDDEKPKHNGSLSIVYSMLQRNETF